MNFVTLLIAIIGGLIFNFLQMPLAWFLGAMFFVALSCRFASNLSMPKTWQVGATTLLGTIVGALVNADILSLLVLYAPSIAVMLICQLLLIAVGIYFFLRSTQTDKISALFAAYPGAISQVTALSLDYSCDSRMVTMNHTIRVFTVIAFIPLLIGIMIGGDDIGGIELHPGATESPQENIHNYGWPIIISAAGYFIAKYCKIITPALYGPMILAALLGVSGLLPEAKLGQWLITIAQVVIGASVGLRLQKINISDWQRIRSIHLPYVFVLLIFTLVSAWLMHQLLSIPFETSLLIMTPGGLSEMVLVAYALNIDPVMVTSHHVIRSLFSLLLIPLLIHYWAKSKRIL